MYSHSSLIHICNENEREKRRKNMFEDKVRFCAIEIAGVLEDDVSLWHVRNFIVCSLGERPDFFFEIVRD